MKNEIKDEDIRNEVRVLIDEKKINLVSDSSMLEELKKIYMDEEFAIRFFDSFLREVCPSFGRNYYFENFGGKLAFTSCTSFVSSLHECEKNIGIDHNLGELNCAITLKMMEKIRASSETIMFMCSDDRKARNVLLSMNQDSVKYQCHTTGSSFVSIFHQGLKKEDVMNYIQKYCEYRDKKGQSTFSVYRPNGEKEKRPCLEVLNDIFEGKVSCNKKGDFIKTLI